MSAKIVIPLVIFIVLLMGYIWVEVLSRQENPTDIQVHNASGSPKAFVSYNPGISDIQERVVTAFVNGLIQAGWQVDLTTTSKQTPTDLSNYDLFVVSTNTYWWSPDVPTRRYLKSLELDGLATAILVTASGQGGRALNRTEQLVANAGGNVIEKSALFVWKPNDDAQTSRPNKEVAEEIAYNLAVNLSLP